VKKLLTKNSVALSADTEKSAASEKRQSVWYLYIIRTVDNHLYTGISTDVKRRFIEHCKSGSKSAAKYLKAHEPESIAFYQAVGNRSLAQKVEYRFKQLSRHQKDAVIRQNSLIFDSRSGAITIPTGSQS